MLCNLYSDVSLNRKRPRNASESVDNVYTQIKTKMKNLIQRLRQQMFRLEVYSQDASRSASSKKLAQHAEAATLEKRIRDTKLEVSYCHICMYSYCIYHCAARTPMADACALLSTGERAAEESDRDEQ